MPEFTIQGVRLNVPRQVASPRIYDRIREGMYENTEAKCARRRIVEGDRVLELGAGLGYVTTICARRAGAQNVLSVEADPTMVEIIRGNLALNSVEEVDLRHGAAVGETGGKSHVTFNVTAAFWASSLQDNGRGNQKTVDVPLLSVHDLMAEQKSTVVMMDVEGAEADMFDRPWPDHVRAVMMELHPKKFSPGTVKRIFDRLSQHGLAYDPEVSRGDVVCLSRDQEF
ncbi:MAG: FkbM family methyltransferase [Pseudomonadota bacterium]